MDQLAAQVKESGLVILAGAGISMLPPTSLPNWNQFNTIVLTALAKRVGAYTNQNFADDQLVAFLERRDASSSFSPDFQAQLIEEEVGADYFRVLQALDTEARNACHESIAALAKGGFLKAVVTTNFDRLIERALIAAEVPYRVFYDGAQFDELNHLVAAGQLTPLPVIKVHGSVEAPESMVDTLRQRVIGRPQALEDALVALLERHHWLVVGFSGADLDYDPNYLGLRQAVGSARGMTFLNRIGTQPRAVIQQLIADYGASSRIIDGALPDALHQLQTAIGQTPLQAPDAAGTADRLAEVTGRAQGWADQLGNMQAVNIFSALMDAAGGEENTLRLLRRVWRFYRGADDTSGYTYWRYNYNYGRRLAERGELGQDVGDTEDFLERVKRGEAELSQLDNGYQFLARAASEGHLPPAYIDLAYVYALLGGPQKGLDLIEPVLSAMLEQKAGLQYADACSITADICELTGAWSTGLDYLERAYPIIEAYGDDPRRARLCTQFARMLAFKERYDEALARADEGLRIAERLSLQTIHADALAAHGLIALSRNQYDVALSHLMDAHHFYARTGRRPRQVIVLLDIARAAFFSGSEERLNTALDALREHGPEFPGLEPHFHVLMVELLYHNRQPDGMRTYLTHLRESATETRNRWALMVADHYQTLLHELSSADS